jgi:hypothetical protein
MRFTREEKHEIMSNPHEYPTLYEIVVRQNNYDFMEGS